MYSILVELKRRLFNFPAPLTFLSCRVETVSTLLYAQETTTAQLRSQFCFPDRLVILNEDRILSND